MDRFLARSQRFAVVGSTNDVVRGWLDEGIAEVCLAIADEQTAGRGREGRSWIAPPDAALLLSLGFRPTWLAPERVWQLAGIVSLAMAEAAEEVARLPDGSIGLKWPNDLVLDGDGGRLRKLAGVLGETDGLGTRDPRVIVGLGINADWPAATFPTEFASTMTSLRQAAHDRPIDRIALARAFVDRLKPRVQALRGGRFDGPAWRARQVSVGRVIELAEADGRTSLVRALDVDQASGALVVEDGTALDGRRAVVVGEVVHAHLAEPVAGEV